MSVPCIVHLDLKGAPWKIDYLFKVISFIKDNGARGVLIEWEDTFPYTSELINIGSLGGCGRDGMYSHDEVKSILRFIKDSGLEPIQLVQTIGHMEFVLKHDQYRGLRELPHSPAVLCPSKPHSLMLVQAIIRQVMDIQPDAAYLHIGADEAWHMNVCVECRQKTASNENGPVTLYLDHIHAVASYVKEKYPGIAVLMWDDMMRQISVEVLNGYKLSELVQPVVWDYNVREQLKLDGAMWARYSRVFAKLWAASAFKGADGSCQMVCSSRRYASNQLAWRDEMKAQSRHIKFSGIILTGWSRYDHYATLCELLPLALPSLATCLRMWTRPDGFVNEDLVRDRLPLSAWCGHAMVSAMQAAMDLRARTRALLDGDQVMSWLNPWQVDREYTSPLQAENIAMSAKNLASEFESIRRNLSTQLHSLTGRRSAEEVIHTWLTPVERRLHELITTALTRAHVPPGLAPALTTGDMS